MPSRLSCLQTSRLGYKPISYLTLMYPEFLPAPAGCSTVCDVHPAIAEMCMPVHRVTGQRLGCSYSSFPGMTLLHCLTVVT